MKINQCFLCKKQTKNPKFCSRSCSAKVANKKPKRKKKVRFCSHCGQPRTTAIRNLLCHDCCANKQKFTEAIRQRTIANYADKECLKKLHTSSKFAHIRGLCRSWHKNKTKLPCYVCGYDKHVELAHIRPISSFEPTTTLAVVNSAENIVQLCRNCHWEFDHGLISLASPDQS